MEKPRFENIKIENTVENALFREFTTLETELAGALENAKMTRQTIYGKLFSGEIQEWKQIAELIENLGEYLENSVAIIETMFDL